MFQCMPVYPAYWCCLWAEWSKTLLSLPNHLHCPISFSPASILHSAHSLPSPLHPASFNFSPSPSLYLTHSTPSPSSLDRLSRVREGQTCLAHFGRAPHLSGVALCIQGERLMGPGDGEGQDPKKTEKEWPVCKGLALICFRRQWYLSKLIKFVKLLKFTICYIHWKLFMIIVAQMWFKATLCSCFDDF